MKIAIASVNKTKNSEISTRGGRSPYYLIFNEKKELIQVVSNPFTVGGGGAGIAVAKMIADMNIDVLIAGKLGEKMTTALDERSVKYIEKEGNVKDVLENFISNK